MTRRPSSSGGARQVRCRCGRPVLRQLVGLRAALDVTADAGPLTAAAAAALREPNRLDWCVRTRKDGPDLAWVDRSHPADCPRPHVIDHQCTAPPAGPPRRRTTRQPPVAEGQLTLG
ncbi:hypothetical protein ACF1BE_19705 [Streptomyces sp. NPDC014991]|uniref:hypothetical protein n=1 Tax=Streptomyces sp. NPDC014991 TaxID=3364935 RepID=UPI0036FBC6AE